MRDPAERLRDILDCIDRIEAHAPPTQDALVADEKTQVWVLHHLLIIGEAVRSLPDDVLARAPEIPWPKIAGLRNVLVHEYFAIDVPTIWRVLRRDVEPLRDAVRRLLTELETTSGG